MFIKFVLAKNNTNVKICKDFQSRTEIVPNENNWHYIFVTQSSKNKVLNEYVYRRNYGYWSLERFECALFFISIKLLFSRWYHAHNLHLDSRVIKMLYSYSDETYEWNVCNENSNTADTGLIGEVVAMLGRKKKLKWWLSKWIKRWNELRVSETRIKNLAEGDF